jgi:hypothetical protein
LARRFRASFRATLRVALPRAEERARQNRKAVRRASNPMASRFRRPAATQRYARSNEICVPFEDSMMAEYFDSKRRRIEYLRERRPRRTAMDALSDMAAV